MDFSEKYHQIKRISENLSTLSNEELLNFYSDANAAKSEYENFQLVVKRNSNSLYGVSASIFYSLVDFDVAEDITMTGKHFAVIVDKAINKFFVNWGEKELEIIREFYPNTIRLRKFTEYKPDTKNDLCVYGDTDSRYIDLEKIYSLIIYDDNGVERGMKVPKDDKELADFGVFMSTRFINEIIKKTIDSDCEYRNAKKGYLKMNHEITTRRCVFRKKKQYIMTAIWKDGKLLSKPKLVFKGVELKKGGTSPRAKKILGKLIDKYLLEGYTNDMLRDECLKLIKYIKARKEKDFIYSISSVSGLKEIKKDTDGIYKSDKNHIQMQIALSWMNFITKNDMTENYQLPFEGQKMNYYYCDESSGYKVIGVPDDVNINLVKGLPEPNWNRMINDTILKPLLRYIYEKEEIDEIDVEHFLLGIKPLVFK